MNDLTNWIATGIVSLFYLHFMVTATSIFEAVALSVVYILWGIAVILTDKGDDND